ncbi:hypothetical protein LOK74_21685 [Brevibacillus humidisoli]|uniref:hypothetical protein n=1 Tax=Brevibacillus humidisoli TaxID=2895522 RepID=UPI001E4704FC|nr:hypothetical protein [Brevibacillus humidisoli]UFJ40599.1 hypothetical protein LOK74_21685 [Brevibacillus humidisoli]
MGQLITTFLCVAVLLVVPLGVVQVHIVMQVQSELADISISASKYISNRGGLNQQDVEQAVRSFIEQELTGKGFRIQAADVTVEVSRLSAADPLLWSHEDQFRLLIGVPYPSITRLFLERERITVSRIGTINVMDYDL